MFESQDRGAMVGTGSNGKEEVRPENDRVGGENERSRILKNG